MNQFIKKVLYLIAFLVPLFFLPITTDIFNINKQFLLALLVLLAVIAWIGKIIYTQEIKIIKTPLDYAFLALIASYTLASVFSLDWVESVLGFSGNGLPPLITVIVFVLLYFLIINNVTHKKTVHNIIDLLLLGSTLISLVALFNIWGQPFLPGLAGQPAFNLLGSQSTFIIYLTALIPLLLTEILNKQVSWKRSVLLLIPLTLILTLLFVISFQVGWISLLIGSGSFFLLMITRQQYLSLRVGVSSLVAGLVVIAVLGISWQQMPQLIDHQLPAEISLGSPLSWQIAKQSSLSSFKQILMGTGPGTFVYNFSQYRPASFNHTPLWQVRFNSAHNFYAEILTTTGWLGLVLWILLFTLFVGTIFFLITRITSDEKKILAQVKSFKPDPNDSKTIAEGKAIMTREADIQLILIGLLASFLSIIVSLFFYVGSFPIFFLLFLILILAIKMGILTYPAEFKTVKVDLKISAKYSLTLSFAFVLVLATFVFWLTLLIRLYVADFNYQKTLIVLKKINSQTPAEQTQTLAAGQFYINESIKANPFEADYQLASAQIALKQALLEMNQPNPSPDAEKISLALLGEAINRSQRATQLNPANVAIIQARGDIFKNTSRFSAQSQEMATSAYQKAVSLEPTNPILKQELGNSLRLQALNPEGALTDKKTLKTAIDNLNQALDLNQEYILARINLALALEVAGRTEEAISHLRAGLVFPEANKNERILFELGRILYNQSKNNPEPSKNLQESAQFLNQALKINPDYSNALFSLALVKVQQKETEPAIKLLKQVLTLNPSRTDIIEKIAELEHPNITPEAEVKAETNEALADPELPIEGESLADPEPTIKIEGETEPNN